MRGVRESGRSVFIWFCAVSDFGLTKVLSFLPGAALMLPWLGIQKSSSSSLLGGIKP